jgi:hypothetical protein
MADKSWGFKIFCECGSRYYSMNKKDKISCPVCSAEYVPEEMSLRVSPALLTKSDPKKKIEEIENFEEDTSDDQDDLISLDDQKEIEESEEEFKS